MRKVKLNREIRFGFSDEFKAKVREQINPISMKVLREVSDSPPILIEELRCQKCGFVYKYEPAKRTLATAIHDVRWTHEYSWDTGSRCGGQFAFVTRPGFL